MGCFGQKGRSLPPWSRVSRIHPLLCKRTFVISSDGEASTIQRVCFPERSGRHRRHFHSVSFRLMRVTPRTNVLFLLSDTRAWLCMEHLFPTSWFRRVPCHPRGSLCPLPLGKMNFVNRSFSASLPGSNQSRRRGSSGFAAPWSSGEADLDDALGSRLQDSFSSWPF